MTYEKIRAIFTHCINFTGLLKILRNVSSTNVSQNALERSTEAPSKPTTSNSCKLFARHFCFCNNLAIAQIAKYPSLRLYFHCKLLIPGFFADFQLQIDLGAFIGVETAALTFRTRQYSTSYSSHICYCKRFYNDFFLNHNTIALVRNCLLPTSANLGRITLIMETNI